MLGLLLNFPTDSYVRARAHVTSHSFHGVLLLCIFGGSFKSVFKFSSSARWSQSRWIRRRETTPRAVDNRYSQRDLTRFNGGAGERVNGNRQGPCRRESKPRDDGETTARRRRDGGERRGRSEDRPDEPKSRKRKSARGAESQRREVKPARKRKRNRDRSTTIFDVVQRRRG